MSKTEYSLTINRDSHKNVENIKLSIISGKSKYNYAITYTKDFTKFFTTSFEVYCGKSIKLNNLLKELDFPLNGNDNLYIFLYTLPQIPENLTKKQEILYSQKYRQFSGFYTSNAFVHLNSFDILSTEDTRIPGSFGSDAAFVDAKFSKINIIERNKIDKLYFAYNYKTDTDSALACFLNGEIFKIVENPIGIVKNAHSGFLISIDVSRATIGHLKCIVGKYESGAVNFSVTQPSQSIYIINDSYKFNANSLIFIALIILFLYIVKKSYNNNNNSRSP